MKILKLCLVAAVFLPGACRDREKISPEVASCFAFENLRRGEKVEDALVYVRASGGLMSKGWLVTQNGTQWSTCELPVEYMLKDSTAIYVSGYVLTSPELEVMNISPLPFEITSSRLR